jgi:hypothetical protein
MNISQEDHDRFYKEKPDDDFSPEHNKWVIENSIRKMDAMILKKRKEWRDHTGERVDAILTYLNSLWGSDKPIEKYFGRRGMAYLRGEEVLDKVYEKRISMNTQTLSQEKLGKF